MSAKTCIILAGPTASGKTDLSVQLASQFNTSILSADSRQCYQELSIGVARPEPDQLSAVTHYFIATHSVSNTFSAADFEKYALSAAIEILLEKDIVIMVGGTGLYIKAFADGLDMIPETSPLLREQIISSYEQNGLQWLSEQLVQHDPIYAASGEMKNPQRMMRALEVVKSTGQSILRFQQKQKKERNFKTIKICLDLPREILYERINHRVDQMMEQGLLEEVKSLIPFRQLNALQTVGYRELFEYLDGKLSLDEAINLIKQNTRHYAKRQITWFKKDPDFIWLKPNAVMDYVLAQANNQII